MNSIEDRLVQLEAAGATTEERQYGDFIVTLPSSSSFALEELDDSDEGYGTAGVRVRLHLSSLDHSPMVEVVYFAAMPAEEFVASVVQMLPRLVAAAE